MTVEKNNKDIKVCHVTSVHNRYDVRIFHKECKSLAKEGYDVILVVNDNIEDELIDGIQIMSTYFNSKNRYQRMIMSQRLIKKKVIGVDADIYHLHDPDLLPIGNKLKKAGKKVIFDSHEDVPRQIKDKEWIPHFIRNIISKAYGVYEKISVKRYDAVISVTPDIVERLKAINPDTVMVTNYPIIDIEQSITRDITNVMTFIGGITEQYRHHNILEAIESIDQVRYKIAGKVTKEYLDRLKLLPAWDKVEYAGEVPHGQVQDIYRESAFGIATHQSTQLGKKGSLGVIKLFEFMAAGLPVICTNYELWEEIIETHQCGICVDPNNVDEIRCAIEYMIDNPEEAKNMGIRGRLAVINEYNWKIQEQNLVKLYKNL